MKVCGITRAEDATAAARYGAAAVGFIFTESLRKIDVERASIIAKEVPDSVSKVGVFVNEKLEVIKEIIKTVGINMVQLHGEETGEFCKKVEIPAIKTIKVKNRELYPDPGEFKGSVWAFLLDTYDPEKYGGTGRSFHWEVVNEVKRYHERVIVAGGININNVTELIQNYQPFGIDVSSSLEDYPGIKSEEKIKDFMEKVKEAERDTISI